METVEKEHREGVNNERGACFRHISGGGVVSQEEA